MIRRWLLAFLLMELLVVAGCGGGKSTSSSSSPSGAGSSGNGQVVLQSITISPSSATIAQGTTQAFTAIGNYSDGGTKDLTATAQWACLLPNVATVSSSSPTQGMATAISPGMALITAVSGAVSNSAPLTITAATVSSLAVTPATATIGFENQQQFTATATFSDMTTQDVTNLTCWSPCGSFSPLFVTNSGLAIGNVPGTYSINPSFNGVSALLPPTLTVDLSNLVSVAVLPATAAIAPHTQVTFSAIGTFSDGSTRDVSSIATWSSSDTTKATFAPTGSTATSTGNAGVSTISATVGTFIPTATLTVSTATLSAVTVLPASLTVAQNTKSTLTAVGVFSDGSTQHLTTQTTWSTADPTVASVIGKGLLTGVGAGTTAVTVTGPSGLGSIQGSNSVTVTAANLQSIAVTPATAFTPVADVINYSAVGSFDDGSTQDISLTTSWASSDKTVATTTPAVATAVGIGQTSITAQLTQISGGTAVTGTADLSVASPAQISVAVAPATVQIANGTSAQLTATGTFFDGTVRDVTALVYWSSSAPAVATVGYQTGIVSGLGAGSSTITATVGSSTSTSQMTVTSASMTSIDVTPANPSIAVGASLQFTATGNFSDSTTQTLIDATWSSSNPAVAVVSSAGSCTATQAGTALITATYNGTPGSTNLTAH